MRRKALTLGITPFQSANNVFVNRFASCFSTPAFEPCDFRQSRTFLRRYRVVILHWPNRYFSAVTAKDKMACAIRLGTMLLFKIFFGTKFVWVAHNVAPHDSKHRSEGILNAFFRLLDGVIFLSAFSRKIVQETYPALANKMVLVTRHGHYREMMATPATPRHAVQGKQPTLAFFGLIRPYKNVEALVDLIEAGSTFNLLIAGRAEDKELATRIRQRATAHPSIQLDIRDEILPDADLESAIDKADAIVLPYKDILNSGSVFLALSRNRPVLAPRVGSLPELQAAVGSNWLSLYDGALTQETAQAFCAELMRPTPDSQPDLSTYDWAKIGEELQDFILSLDKK